ncbi:unnamed protein product [Pedinophyceae sp. YPF-701]|nr:unnamed protein product [Pedinophyceae sp. YPF-701]
MLKGRLRVDPRARVALDWVALAALVAVSIGIEEAEPFHQEVTKMTDLRYEMSRVQPQSVPSWSVVVMAASPLLAVAAWCFAAVPPTRRGTEVHAAVRSLLASCIITHVLTNVMKVTLGRLRPDFFFRCWPDGEATYGSDGVAVCSGDADLIRNGRKSFPSGHSSLASAGLTWLSWYLMGRANPLDSATRGQGGRVPLLALVLAPTFGAMLVAATRVRDHWHHPSDVIAGYFMGVFLSLAAYVAYFPVPWSHSPDTAGAGRHRAAAGGDGASSGDAGSVSMQRFDAAGVPGGALGPPEGSMA